MIDRMSVRHRAEPLSPEERRSAIVEAVIPLLLEQGSSATTAQMAEAAGIAEGTIFRVFPDKVALVHEAVRTCLDPGATITQIEGIERALPIEVKLRKLAAILVQKSERVHALASVLRSMPAAGEDHRETHKAITEANSRIFEAMSRVLEADGERLAVDPGRAAAAFRGLMFAVSYPLSDPDQLITAEEAISVFLEGVLRREGP